MYVYGIGEPTPTPSICIICENQSGRMANTGRELDLIGHHLSGHRLVCEGCTSELAEGFGYIALDRYEALERAHQDALRENAVLREKHLGDVEAVIEAVRERMDSQKVSVAPPARKAPARAREAVDGQ